MPKFSYIVKDREGKAYKNVSEAPSQEVLIERLQKQEYFIISIKEVTQKAQTKKKSKGRQGRRFSHKKVKLTDLLTFANQLAAMLEAGVTLIRSLDVIHSQIQSEKLHEVIGKVRADVEQGVALSLCLEKHPKIFNQFWVSLIEVGEASGTIPVILHKLAFYLRQQAEFRSTIVSGLIYPLILFFVSMGAVAFFALFVGPRFESIFESMGAELPLITVALLSLFKFIKTYIFIIIGSIIAFIFFLRKYIRTYQGRLVYENTIFNLPTMGEVYRLVIVERFASQMAILIEAGVPILYALDITERLVDNATCAQIVNDIKESVRKGELLVDPMERSGFFPPMCLQMITVGEETGELSKMLNHISMFYQDTVKTFMTRFATIIEPFMLVFMGVVIGTIVLAMFLPMFNIAQLGGGAG